jgi:predicted ATPase
LLNYCLILLLQIEYNSIVLLDEPETYMHPNFVVTFVAMLERILEYTESHAILATHSIFLVRELPKTSVRILSKSDENASFYQPESETLGASLDRLAYEFFSDEDVEKNSDHFIERYKKRKNKVRLPLELAVKAFADD